MDNIPFRSHQEEIQVQVIITVIVEVRRLSIGIGIAACIANALVSSDATIKNVESLIQASPVLPIEFVEALNYIRGLDASSRVSRSLWQLMTKLRRAKVTTVEAAINSSSPFGIPASRFMQTALSWRASCRTAIEAMQGLKELAQRYNLEICTSTAWTRLPSFLEEVASGGHSWVMPNGDIVMPEWADRRQSERIQLKSHAIMSWGDKAREVLMKDISESGLGLELGIDGIGEMDLGDKVTVQLECGGILYGKVAWIKKGKAGIEVVKRFRAHGGLS
ncbi:MAG TPA: PilZ domain-containing protein [Hyphomicrobiaceae bacterium]|nr:PilZ domain-containing protein [Hyphomicrobiaceae bacterium]